MKLTKFKEKNHKKIGIILFTISCVLLVTIVFLYKSFALFETNEIKNIINGQVQDPGDLYFVFYVNDVLQKDMPTKESGYVFNSQKSFCKDLETQDSFKLWWDREDWSIIVKGLKTSRTKCNLYFDEGTSLVQKIQSIPLNTTSDGLYQVSHDNAEITYTDDENAIQNFTQEELRYAGKDPNNYVWFNNELWRIIGLVNTPEGKRVKLIRNESIGFYSWDISEYAINNGNGINEWSLSKLNTLLNEYYLNSVPQQICYTGRETTINCDFLDNGLKYVRNFIEYSTWPLGSNGEEIPWGNSTTKEMYNVERSKYTGDYCKNKEKNEETERYCNDKFSRTTSWKGNIALMYPSDYGYGTSGNSDFDREQCLTSNLFNWPSSCYENNWLNKNVDTWTLTPAGALTMAELAYRIHSNGMFTTVSSALSFNWSIFPTIFIKEDILVSSNSTGTSISPYIIG